MAEWDLGAFTEAVEHLEQAADLLAGSAWSDEPPRHPGVG